MSAQDKTPEKLLSPDAFSADEKKNGPMTPGNLGTDIHRYMRRYKEANLDSGICNYFNNGFFGRYIAGEEISLAEVMVEYLPGNLYNQFTGKLFEGIVTSAALLALPGAQAHTACNVETRSGVDVYVSRAARRTVLKYLGIEVKGSFTGTTTHRLSSNEIKKIQASPDTKCAVEAKAEHQAYNLTGFRSRLCTGHDLPEALTPGGSIKRTGGPAGSTELLTYSQLVQAFNYLYG